jgi:LCP family protein required for cell wall assembly
MAKHKKSGKKSNVKPASNSDKKDSRKRKKSSTLQEKIIIAVSIIVGIIIIAVMVLNIPIIAVTKTNNDGSTYTEYVSILKWVKSRQPLVEKEGVLSKDTNSYELNSEAEEVDDKRDFTNDQIIEGQFTVLCLGFDESRSNSDVMMLFHFDIVNDKINILQIPRDSYVPDYTSSENGKINSVYTLGDESLIPIQRTVDAVRDTFGIPIDRYITTGCDDIVDMVDMIGGIPIDLPEDVFYSYDKILYAGEQVLNGEQAELFVRARKGYMEGDIGRVKAQRIFLAAAMEKALDMGTVELTKFLTEVYNKGYIGTDLTLQEMSILSDFGSKMDLDDVTVHMVPGEAVDDYNGYSVWSIHKDATVDLLNEYFRPYQPDLTYDSLPITEIVESDYQTTDIYDDTQDTLQEIADGAKPGESKKATEPATEETGYSREEYGYDEEDDYGY